MSTKEISKIIELLNMVKSQGLTIKISDGDLCIANPDRLPIEDRFLRELTENKDQIIDYLSNNYLLNQPHKTNGISISNIAESNGYYKVSEDLTYWLNDEVDKEFKLLEHIHGNLIFCHSITGTTINIEAIKKSISFLTDRHDSLRCTFHLLENQYWMKVEDKNHPMFVSEILEIDQSVSDAQLKQLIYFDDYSFSFSKGPLFFSRIIKISDSKIILSFKLHHIIFDSWSYKVLLRDLTIAYNCICGGKRVRLSPLKFQFQDYLQHCDNLASKNGERDRLFWKSKFDRMAPEILLNKVIRKNYDIAKKRLIQHDLEYKVGTVQRLLLISKELNVSVFIVLIAIIKNYILSRTGKKDILIGTSVHGRDADTLEQIGCYAKTVLIRTVLDYEDCFNDVITKVNNANNDAAFCTGLSLESYLNEIASSDHIPGSCFQNINILLTDMSAMERENTQYVEQSASDLKIEYLPFPIINTIMPIDIEFIYFLSRDQLQLSILCDGSLYSIQDIVMIGSDLLNFTEILLNKV